MTPDRTVSIRPAARAASLAAPKDELRGFVVTLAASQALRAHPTTGAVAASARQTAAHRAAPQPRTGARAASLAAPR